MDQRSSPPPVVAAGESLDRDTGRQFALGVFISLLSAMAFALNVVCVSVALEHGVSVHAVNVVRPVTFLIALLAVVWWQRTPVSLPNRARTVSFAIGALLCVEMYAVHTAIGYIQVGLAILLMYTYPLIVTLLSCVLAGQRVSPWLLVAAAAAFAGLALALHTPGASLDPRGVALAALAAVGMTALVMLSDHVMASHDNNVVMIHVNVSAGIIMVIVAIAGAQLQWPQDVVGTIALVSATTLYVLATFLLFIGIHMIGAVRFSVIDNTAPVWAIVFGFLVLEQALSNLQIFGALLVVGGVIAVQLIYRPPPPS